MIIGNPLDLDALRDKAAAKIRRHVERRLLSRKARRFGHLTGGVVPGHVSQKLNAVSAALDAADSPAEIRQVLEDFLRDNAGGGGSEAA